MSRIRELAEVRARAAQYVQNLGMSNAYGRTLDEQVAADARYRLAHDAWMKAETDYREAIAALSVEDLLRLSQSGDRESRHPEGGSVT